MLLELEKQHEELTDAVAHMGERTQELQLLEAKQQEREEGIVKWEVVLRHGQAIVDNEKEVCLVPWIEGRRRYSRGSGRLLLVRARHQNGALTAIPSAPTTGGSTIARAETLDSKVPHGKPPNRYCTPRNGCVPRGNGRMRARSVQWKTATGAPPL